MGKLIVFGSAVLGSFLFVLVLFFAGFENIIVPFRKFSLFYLSLFLFITLLLHIISTLRWHSVLRYQGFRVSLAYLFKIKIIGSSINYITPAARVGGEPLRGFLAKKRLGVKSPQA